jgi:hypothetical protein
MTCMYFLACGVSQSLFDVLNHTGLDGGVVHKLKYTMPEVIENCFSSFYIFVVNILVSGVYATRTCLPLMGVHT